jgi:hypothetical protein
VLCDTGPVSVRRGLVLWLLLFGVYAATLGIDAAPGRHYAGAEPHYLLMAESIVSDGDIDLRDEYRDHRYRAFHHGALRPNGRVTHGRLHEPQAAGLSLAIAPAWALGGARLVELELAALAALAFVLAVALARRLVPEPWATAAPLACALSPPALASATAVYPDSAAAALLAGAAILALRSRQAPRARTAIAAGLLLALLPWLGIEYLAAGAVILLAQWRWLAGRGRGFHGLLAAEALFASLVVYVTVNGQLYAGLTPYAARLPGPHAAADVGAQDLLDRAPRLLSLWLDRGQGLLRWAPAFALAFFAAWLLWRSRRDRVARAVPEQRGVEVAASLLLAGAGAQALVAALAAPTISGPWFPGRHLVAVLPIGAALAAWGLRHAHRLGAALSALTVAAGVWLCATLYLDGGGWSRPPSEIPWGPLRRLLPDFATEPGYASVVVGVLVAGLAAVALYEWRRARRTGELALKP